MRLCLFHYHYFSQHLFLLPPVNWKAKL